MASETKRTRRNTLERRCLGKAFKRLFVNAPKGVFKMLEKVKRPKLLSLKPADSRACLSWLLAMAVQKESNKKPQAFSLRLFAICLKSGAFTP